MPYSFQLCPDLCDIVSQRYDIVRLAGPVLDVIAPERLGREAQTFKQSMVRSGAAERVSLILIPISHLTTNRVWATAA